MTRWLQSSLVVLAMACGAPPVHPIAPPPKLESPKTSIPIGATAMLDDLQQIGVDPTKDTDLGKIEIGKKRKLMRLFTQSLGTDCSGCHEDDFKTDTQNKKIARHMWTDFVAVLRDANDAPIFCDTCHQGKMKVIARDDDKVLAAFMKANYVEKMTRGDKAEHKCATCHGDPFDPDIFKNKFKAE
jgi:hypothetical protein